MSEDRLGFEGDRLMGLVRFFVCSSSSSASMVAPNSPLLRHLLLRWLTRAVRFFCFDDRLTSTLTTMQTPPDPDLDPDPSGRNLTRRRAGKGAWTFGGLWTLRMGD